MDPIMEMVMNHSNSSDVMDHGNHMDHHDHMEHMENMDIEMITSTASPVMNHMHHGSDVIHDVINQHEQGHSMKMFFNWDTEGITVLFSCWTIDSTVSLLSSMFILFAMSVAYEGLKVGRELLLSRMSQSNACKCGVLLLQTVHEDFKHKDVVNSQCECRNPTKSVGRFSVAHVVQSVLHMVQVVVSYCLMLVFMTFNLWLCLAITLGSGVGYFVFAWRRKTLLNDNEHCN